MNTKNFHIFFSALSVRADLYGGEGGSANEHSKLSYPDVKEKGGDENGNRI